MENDILSRHLTETQDDLAEAYNALTEAHAEIERLRAAIHDMGMCCEYGPKRKLCPCATTALSETMGNV